MGWRKPSHSALVESSPSSEGVFDTHLDDAVPLFLGGDAEIRIVRLQSVLIEAEVEIQPARELCAA